MKIVSARWTVVATDDMGQVMFRRFVSAESEEESIRKVVEVTRLSDGSDCRRFWFTSQRLWHVNP